MYSSTVTLVLLSCIVALVNAQCSCQTKPPIDVIYQGEACECGRKYPVQMEVPKITEHRDAHYDYGFTVERPQQSPAQIKYTFDFHMEKPKPIPAESLATYGFDVQNPVQEEIEVPKRYRFDYQLETPVVKSEPSNLQGLLAHVDKVVIQKQDCPTNINSGCQCTSYKPTIDILQRCPSHGHLYRYGGALYPSYAQRYNQVSSSFQHQTPDQVSTSSGRSKRDIANTFPIQIQHLLPGLLPNNHIMKATEEEENQNRISKILKTNFGDQNENIEELLRPKPLGYAKEIQNDVENVQATGDLKSKTPDFILKIKPKLEEARSNIRSQISKIVNKARLDTIRAKHMMQKRSTETSSEASTEFTESDPTELFSGDFDGSYEPIWLTPTTENAEVSEENAEEPTENVVNDPVNANDKSPSNNGRIRKHCDRCGELARRYPCPSCGAYPSDVPPSQRNPIPYNHGHTEYNAQPRYKFGNRGSQQDVDVTVGSYHNEPAYGELEDILDKNSKTIYSQNRRIDGGHLLQPMDFSHASDAIRFIQELTQRNDNQYNEDYISNGNSYDVGSSSRNYPAKRSFKIIPLAEKDDGSVFVKISPTGPFTKSNNNKPKGNDNSIDYTKSYDADETKNMFNDKKPTANFEKFVRNGKKYEILALSPNGSEEGSLGSEEDMEILKYVYAVNQKENQKQKSTDVNKSKNGSKNTEIHMET